MLRCLLAWQALEMLLIAGNVDEVLRETAFRASGLEDWDAVEGIE